MKINKTNILYFFRFISPLKGSENRLSNYENVFTSPSGGEKQKEILDSIYYARRIQRSLLPNEKYVERVLLKIKSS